MHEFKSKIQKEILITDLLHKSMLSVLSSDGDSVVESLAS